jgi:hypothetical protein
MIRRYLAVIGWCAAVLFAQHSAQAQTAACTNDTDCPDAACGGQVCDWSTTPHTCKPAGTYPQGQDGWCTTTANCKCSAQGATCVAVQCSQTLPTGSTGAGGSASGGATGTAGASSVAGSSAAAAGSSAAGSSATGPSSSSSDSSSSGGCAMGRAVPRGSLGIAFGAACAAALVGARRRRRAA